VFDDWLADGAVLLARNFGKQGGDRSMSSGPRLKTQTEEANWLVVFVEE
jgi:hypothetical protein